MSDHFLNHAPNYKLSCVIQPLPDFDPYSIYIYPEQKLFFSVYSPEPILSEVTVKGERLPDAKPVHDSEACGIGEREIFVVELGDNCPGSTLISSADTDGSCGTPVKRRKNRSRHTAAKPSKD
jgi:hypothetical protein